ncbi:related to SKT5-protoplast regeneration and killer toxin resistance protein [Sporisorium reilianum SRZ2]|uniref:Related to SKT5-protoplast regeneration and killer toxin resistance protein n=1 Tax=Sporisorium reilianum (strain SRZ2) TaxID=999809 RepID=E7A2A2_SPORE|nr:related to SKT5-protoplast regeneration and killer toxin resistance protein [Sporisorium reilianum SRZ2]
MATPASSAYAFHHRFDAVPDKHTPIASGASATAPNGEEHFEYPDLDAGQFYSSAAPHAAAAPAPAPAPSTLPDFPEFKSFDSKSEFFSNNNFFQQYAPQPALSAALVEPQSAQIEGSPELDQLDTSATSEPPQAAPEANAPLAAAPLHQQAPAQLASPPHPPQHAAAAAAAAPAPRLSTEATRAAVNGNAHSLSHQQPEPQQPQLERHFSSASSYVQQPSVHTSSHDSQAPSHHSHTSHRSPLPKPPSMPNSPPMQHTQMNPVAHQQAMSPRSPPAPASAFPAQTAPGAGPAHLQAPSPQKPLPQPSAADALPMAGLHINGGERSIDQQPQPQQPSAHPANIRDDNVDRTRPSSFFGMQRPAAALNAAGQQVPVPASMLADDDGFYQDQQHLNQPNGPGQPQQRNPQDLQQAPRPSSFFGTEGDLASNGAPDSVSNSIHTRDASAPGTRRSSFHRAESTPRGISTAAGGTGNGPMPTSGGFGGLGPAGANRPASIAPSVASGPLLDHSHLKVGQKASLLSHGKTLELYRQNAKKTNDPNLIYELAVFMVDAAKTMGTDEDGAGPVTAVNGPNKIDTQKEELMKEATGLLKKIADRGHPDAQYFLADCYANGIGTRAGKQDFGQAYTYFVLAAKHGHPDAAYRAGTCYEKGWGCRKDAGKALQFYRKSAAQSHPGAMYRLATAELNGELGLKKNAKEGVKWLKRSAEAATPEFPHALHELALLHERGIDNVLFVDPEYSCELLAQAGEMGYAPSAYKLGVNYEYGRMGCPQDGGLSIHMYNIAAQQNHKEACFALTAWYLVGAPGILPQSDTEAYLWAKKAAEQGLAKAEYAVGYFTEMGIGTVKDLAEARAWYKRAADHGDKRANQRVAALQGRGGPTGLAGVGAGAPPPVNRHQQRMEQKQEQRESMHEFGRRAQPTSAPFPASVTQSSMAPSTQMSYPSPLAMREAQTAQREQQYLANVAANERAQADMGSPVSAGASPVMGLPRPPHMMSPPQQQHNQQQPFQVPQPPRQGSPSSQPPMPFSQPQAYPSYPMSASTAPPQPAANGAMHAHNPMFPPAPGAHYAARPGMAAGPGPGPGFAPGPGPAMGGAPPSGPSPPAKADLGKEDDKKKKKGWFGRS